MEAKLEEHLRELAMQQLMKTPYGEKLQQAMRCYQAASAHIRAVIDSDEAPETTGMKILTILTFGILQKVARGKTPAQLDKQDWQDIASAVSRYAVFTDGQAYSVLIFRLYENAIRSCAAQLSSDTPTETVNAITALADTLALWEQHLQAGECTEVQYTEECLWTALEAAVKLAAVSATQFAGKELSAFAQAASAYAFAYGKWRLYQQEQAMIAEFVQGQYQLTAELERKYEAYLTELDAQTQQFLGLVERAFAPDFKEAFLQSVLLADAAGVRAEETLRSLADTDAYFTAE